MEDKFIYAGTGTSFPEQIVFDKSKRTFQSLNSNQSSTSNCNDESCSRPQEASNPNANTNNIGNNLSNLMPLLNTMLPKNLGGNPLISSLLTGKQPNPTEMISTLLQQNASAKKETVQNTPLPLQKLNLDNLKSVDDYYNATD